MQLLGVDYAFAHPLPAAIKAAGYDAVLRYISKTPAKDLNAAELAGLHAAGLAVGVVFETYATRPMSGADGGAADGALVAMRMAELGFPASIPCFYAFDTDDRGQPGWQGAVAAYLAAAAKASGRRALPYGSVRVVDLLGPGWQTGAWSGAAISAKTLIYQRSTPTRPPIAGGGYDENIVIDPSVLWAPGVVSPATDTHPVIISGPQPTQGNETVASLAPPTLKLGSTGQIARNWQGLLCGAGRTCKIDGSFGPQTVALTKDWQGKAGLVADGVVGPASWSRMLDVVFR